jgi:predicted XRE-type DNA-binding protein
MSKSLKKLQALTLRRKGMSIKDIAKKLEVTQSSVSVWCRDIELTDAQRRRLVQKQIAAGHKGRMLGAESNRQKRLRAIESEEGIAKRQLGTLSRRDLFMLGVGLYWGEGVKSGGSTAIVNSDPRIVRCARDWFEYLGVSRSSFRPYIFISEVHKDRSDRILSYWSTHLDIPIAQFNNITFLKGRRSKVYENHDSYYGIVALRVRRGTNLKYRILGLIKHLSKQLHLSG